MNASEIKYRPSLSVRVTYEEDGTPLFCGRDVAEVLGFSAPAKVVSRMDKVYCCKCYIRWCCNSGRNHCSLVICLTEADCKELAKRKKAGNLDAFKWVTNDLIHKAKVNRPPVSKEEKPAQSIEQPAQNDTAPQMQATGSTFDVRHFESKLDAIIAQCVVMKAQIDALYGSQ